MKYITIKLTEDQLMHLKILLVNEAILAKRAAQRSEMAVSKEFLAFNKRLHTTLAKAKS